MSGADGTLPPQQQAIYNQGYFDGIALGLGGLTQAIVPVALFAPLTTTFAALVLFSTPSSRRSVLFWALILAFCMDIIHMGAYVQATVLELQNRSPDVAHKLGNTAELFVPWLFDIALVLKLVNFYPASVFSRRYRAMILAPPGVLLVARFANYWVIIGLLLTADSSARAIYSAQLSEFVLQFVTTVYCTSIMLRKSYELYRRQIVSRDSWKDKRMIRLRYLFESLLMTFLPGTLLSFSLMVCWALAVANGDDSPNSEKVSIATGSLTLCNIYGGLFLSVLATQWSTIRDVRAYAYSLDSQSSVGSSGRIPFEHHASRPGEKQQRHPPSPPQDAHSPPQRAASPSNAKSARLWIGQRAVGPEESALGWLTEPREVLLTEAEREGMTIDSHIDDAMLLNLRRRHG